MWERVGVRRGVTALLAGSEVVFALGVMALVSMFHLWNASSATVYCLEQPGEVVRLDRGGWGDGSWCHSSSGDIDGVEVRPFDLFQPRWSFVLWIGVLIAIPLITARLVRSTERIVDGTTEVRWRRSVRVE